MAELPSIAVISGGKNESILSMFYRIAAVLLLLFAVGHTLGFRQSDPKWGVDALLGSMRSIHFDVQGFNRTYWDLFVAAGFSVGVFYLFAAILAWQLGGLPAATLALMRPRVGVRPLLCRHRGCELEIPLYHADRFLNRDYIMFDGRGMAFSEAGFHASAAIMSERIQPALLWPGAPCLAGFETWAPRTYIVPMFTRHRLLADFPRTMRPCHPACSVFTDAVICTSSPPVAIDVSLSWVRPAP